MRGNESKGKEKRREERGEEVKIKTTKDKEDTKSKAE